MLVRKAVITAAGRAQRGLPLQTLVDRDGVEKAALEILIEEAAGAGAEAVAVVVAPGDEARYRAAVGGRGPRLEFIVQPEPKGYADALLRARDFTNQEPFLHLVGDHLYLSKAAARSAQQVVAVATAERCAVSAVQPTREAMLPYYGVVGGRRVPNRADLHEVGAVFEKPTPTDAEQHLLVPGLRAGFYLCFFGIHVLTPTVLDLLAESAAAGHPGQLSGALAGLVGRERYLAVQVQGQRYNIGVKYGLLTAQLAFGLGGADRDHILTTLVDLLAQQA
ncbi:MAG TPA: sugar phosphate nucleotidyltransferase [Gemmataceae bacterium]|nr:sugar phosphate nucleotidyltransferase [Gemmataceae bacterium]